ncbi:hypothetical protein OIU84_026115 [Salix udensis]|uniref:Uncharacterized protein n=1 Tax=Salix udensis TaxID=889485 RepID=A0AAD6KME6_9ROSI|nr:hypothetical protein OIU84_026115 [Salix udensis]
MERIRIYNSYTPFCFCLSLLTSPTSCFCLRCGSWKCCGVALKGLLKVLNLSVTVTHLMTSMLQSRQIPSSLKLIFAVPPFFVSYADMMNLKRATKSSWS